MDLDSETLPHAASGSNLARAAPFIAEAIVDLLRRYKTSPPDVQSTLAMMLGWMARGLESFVVPGASRAAQRLADELELGDLTRFRWRDQRGLMKDPERGVFHWEHVMPVSDTVKALLALEDPTPSTIVPILMRTEIAWILKIEDKRLPRKDRPDPRAAYVAAGIELLAWSQNADEHEDGAKPAISE